jgi:hypothetical protein
MRKSEPQSRCRAIEFIAPHVSNRANRQKRCHTRKVVVLRRVRKECKSSTRAEARARTNVGRSVGPQPYRARMLVATREISVALPRGLRLESGMRPWCSSTATPNPSVEGIAKRLRLLSTPHLEREVSEYATFNPRCCANGKKSRSAWRSVNPSSMHRVAMSVSMVFRMVTPTARNDR